VATVLKTHPVFFGATGEGEHICISVRQPEFCFIGLTEEEVRSKAERALNFYFEAHGRINHNVSRPISRTNKVVSFVPQKKEEIEYTGA
jgi:predicted RNase H-like HicB family nuclease